MRTVLLVLVILAAAAHAAAPPTANRLPAKPAAVAPPNVPDPARQGGDTIADATVIPAIPFSDTGTTTGYADDYDEVCPYTGSTAPDVVYAYAAATDEILDIDLCGSSYDTKLYVYDEALDLVGCNDDAYFDDECGVYVSALEYVELVGGATYYVVIDGYGGEHGDYVLDVTAYEPCILDCPAGGLPEGEPPLVDGYLDSWNGGCNSPEFGNPFQDLMGDADGDLTFCGVAGWYLYNGYNYRDTDWFYLYMGTSGTIEIAVEAEQPTYLFENYQDCGIPEVHQMILAEPCTAIAMTISGYYDPGDAIWFVVVPTVYEAPPGAEDEYDYVIWFSGLMASVATEPTTWGALKALYR